MQRRIVAALMIREGLRRFGHDNLGFFWVLGEPMVLTVGVMGMWTISGMGHGHNLRIIPFALSGYSMLTLWRHVSGSSAHALRESSGLLFHSNIRLLDILIARCALESLGGFAAFCVAYLPLNLLGYVETIDDPLLLVGGWLFMTWFAFGFGLAIAGLCQMFEVIEHFVPPLLYLTLPVTGAFYMINWLPESAQAIVRWSPLVQVFEMFRAGLFGNEVTADWNVGFLTLCCLGITAVGLTLVQMAQKHIEIH
ncbi:MAG: ABC transporter permease [Ancalomicrobiaceae bacterium]|nr:ABC transporter permease [Ancalomicrobiaceae bacterium]